MDRRCALYDNLGKDEALVLRVDDAVHSSRQDEWRGNAMKTKRVRLAIRHAISLSMSIKPGNIGDANRIAVPPDLEAETDRILELVKHQHEY